MTMKKSLFDIFIFHYFNILLFAFLPAAGKALRVNYSLNYLLFKSIFDIIIKTWLNDTQEHYQLASITQ